MSVRDELERSAPRSLPVQLVVGLGSGAVQGALLGAGFGFWEQVLQWTVGLDSLQDPLQKTVVALYAATGALCGAVMGVAGLEGAGWLLGTAGLLAGWWLSGKVGIAASEAGMTVWTGVVATVPLFGVVCGAAGSALRPQVSLGAGVALVVALLVGLPLNLHLLGDPVSTVALTVDAAVVVGALLIGALASWLAQDKPVVFPLVAGFAVAGWAMAHNTTGPLNPIWTGEATASGPPVVLVMIDTLRADHVGAYGHPVPTTPTLDALARRGTRYAHATAPAPWTLPSAASLLTGAEPRQHGAGVHNGERNTKAPIAADVKTLSELLSAGGYRTAGVVSNPWLLPAFGFARGFDVYDADIGPAPLPIGVHPLRVLGLDPTDWPAYRSATEITEAALTHVKRRHDERGWFLFVHYMDVHAPHRPPERDIQAVGGEPGFAQDYDASLHYVDRELGRLLAALPANAVVVVTSDHGEELSEARTLTGPVPPGTRHGHTLHEELLHVPLLVVQPGQRPALVRSPVGTIDVAPTLARLAGVAWPDEGRDGLPLGEAALQRGRPLRAEAPRYGVVQQSVRIGRHKLIRSQRKERVFDLEADPGEKKPLDLAGGAVLLGLRSVLYPLGAVHEGVAPRMTDELQQMLDALGYTEDPPERGSAEVEGEVQPGSGEGAQR